MSLPSVRQASAQEDERWGVPERTECQNRMPIECQNLANYEKKSVRNLDLVEESQTNPY